MPKLNVLNIIFLAPRFILVAIFMIIMIIAVLDSFDIFEPYIYPLHLAKGNIVSYGNNITIGYYPSAEELEKLKKEHQIEMVISLLNPELPQERALNTKLETLTRKLGLELKYFPLSYFELDSNKNHKTIDDLINFLNYNRSKKIYIHCYLGRHRVKMVRDELERHGLISNITNSGKKRM